MQTTNIKQFTDKYTNSIYVPDGEAIELSTLGYIFA
jgi:hypothetical protein